MNVVAAENFWGSLAEQLGSAHAKVDSIINSPSADPHDYEATAADARTLAVADLVIINGVGYDPWATKLVNANPDDSRTVLTVGDVVRVASGGNPHRWYNPADIRAVLDQITADYKQIDPTDAAFFDRQYTTVIGTNLKAYFGEVDDIKARYGGTPVGASESIFAMIAPALGPSLLTPPGFLTAVSEGTEPSAADKSTIDRQIDQRQIKVYVHTARTRPRMCRPRWTRPGQGRSR